MVGLSTAWFLREAGLEVTVYDRAGVAAGSSFGNAGWISPGMATPLPEPAVLAYGLRALLRADAPLHVPKTFDPALWRFLLQFARHCTTKDWRAAMSATVALNEAAFSAYDELAPHVAAPITEAPLLAGFRTRAQAHDLLEEVAAINAAGQRLEVEELTDADLRTASPLLSDEVGFGLNLLGQKFINPGLFTTELGGAVQRRGVTLRAPATVRAIEPHGDGVRVVTDEHRDNVDVVVLATGAWISNLARSLGVRTPVRAGRGYSFTVPTASTQRTPIYFPAVRVACTPLGEHRLRVAGTMEFRRPEHRLEAGRVRAIIRSGTPLLTGVDWDAREDEWVGSRPVTPDGLAVIGATRDPRVYVAGGHGMWGITLGPATGRALSELIVTGQRPAMLAPFDPLR